jgi:hypothetical protein
MRGRWLFLVAAALAILAAAAYALFLWLSTPPPGVTVANFQRLQVGMTEAQVQQILGAAGKPLDVGALSHVKVWYDAEEDLSIMLTFDDDTRLLSGSLWKSGTLGGRLSSAGSLPGALHRILAG